MNISSAGIALLKQFEGLRLKPYNDVAGHATIGFGHLLHFGNVTPADIKQYANFNLAAAESLLRQDCAVRLATINAKLPKNIVLNQGQIDALLSLLFNIGEGNLFQKSSVWKYIVAGNMAAAAGSFAAWNKAGGKIYPALVARRAAEAALFMSGSAIKAATTILPILALVGVGIYFIAHK